MANEEFISDSRRNQTMGSRKWLYIGIVGAVAVILLVLLFALPKCEGGGAFADAEDDVEKLCPDNNHPHIVDLGLPSGTKWACCNVGASKPEDYGDYFAWGETSTKSTYDDSTYRWCNGDIYELTKYNNDSSFGTIDNRTQLELNDDAARANWGGLWRMPTIAELEELKANCSYEWTTVNGVKGGKFTSRLNGRSIFLPAAGCWRSGASFCGELGYYWSSSLDESFPLFACPVCLARIEVDVFSDNRSDGRSVRPVLRN